ncbi:PAS domain S-box-containing protein/diguanylate cyclase (GGDEF)-like protein [Streptohalobacillus salinus]|uniref:PAS domain S-box-containing protein/diguanylate cyclase (GGDEF)-like protein n=1 Tax=Streptohalobacillus salinus TaxID=621096 RepID=A0A2V3WH33_9BACI|nr:bifunctional diguanylate cyclase/phosphodiesterase [Streptohalobacillus salinus]PXW92721.1 PAS domain S-box-containing protein/diguanylate cyclase (GGDEF)-like protein [Streptohalobacillus salinus]
MLTISDLSYAALTSLLNISDLSTFLFSQNTLDKELELSYMNQKSHEKTGLSITKNRPLNVNDIFNIHRAEKDQLIETLHTGIVTHQRLQLIRNKDITLVDVKVVPLTIENSQTFLLVMATNLDQAIFDEAPTLIDRLANRSLYMHTPHAIFVMDDLGRLLRTNPAGLGLLEYREDECINMHFTDFIDESDHSHGLKAFQAVLAGEVTETVLLGLTKSQEHRHLKIKGIPIQDDTKIVGIVGIVDDVTEEKATQDLLKYAQLQYKSLFTNNIETVATFDLNGKFVDLNDATITLTGYQREELLGRSFEFLLTSDVKALTLDFFNSAQSGVTKEYETKIIHKQGKVLNIYVTLIPIVVDDDIKGINCIVKDMTEKIELHAQLHHMAYHDHLTGLKNQMALYRDFDKLISEQPKDAHALLFIDLDRFKLINDALGHAKGDLVLKQMAMRLNEKLTSEVSVYRYGGDEFIILYKQTTFEKLTSFSQALIEIMSIPYLIDGIDVVNTPSIGISTYPRDGIMLDALIKKADKAMYFAKREKKSTFQFYRDQLPAVTEGYLETEALLRKAIKKNEFVLLYQPQIDAVTKEIFGVEALIRWHREGHGIIPPNDFIPLAEESGLIVPIGKWVFEEAVRAINFWKDAGISPLPVSINLSIRQFYQAELVQMITSILTEANIDPALITIEITESIAMDATSALPILKELKALGLTISIDDFGTGYSSLSYLKKFPIDYLKIDQSFVRDMTTNKDDRDIIESIILLGHRLNKVLIAEGVETREHVDVLGQLGCDMFQGYHFSKPISKNAIIDYYTTFNFDQQ